jgi:4-hydroxy-tetrahydrodipicolinate synthase
MTKVDGVIPALLTLFTRNGAAVDVQATGELVDWLVQQGVSGLFVGGSTGEGPLMSVEERKQLAESVVARASGKVAVVIHTGCTNARDTIELTKHARSVRADAAGIVAPYYYNFDNRALRQYCSRVARAVRDFPLFLYNIPVLVKNDLAPDLVQNLVDRHPNIIGIKDSTGSLQRLEEYARIRGNNFTLICGSDFLLVEALQLGAKGSVSSTANVAPRFFVRLYRNFQRGNTGAARKWQEKIIELGGVLWTPNSIPAMKEMLRLMDLPTGASRSPQRTLTTAERRALQQRLRELNLLS